MRFGHLIGIAALVSACGDEPLCGSDVFVVIQSPSGVALDSDPNTAGIQSDVRVRTNLAAMDDVHLEVMDSGGIVVRSFDAQVDDTGTAVFHDTTLVGPMTTLVATGTGHCGSNTDTVDVGVSMAGTTVQIIDPPVSCGSQITAANDADPASDGVQVVARVTSPGAPQLVLEVTDSTGIGDFDATHDVTVTMIPGTSTFIGIGKDGSGGEQRSDACVLSLVDLAVNFSPPAADGIVSSQDGTVAAGKITFPLCGTVSKSGALVQVAIDGGAPVAADVNGTTWCETVTLAESPPSHTIVASAQKGSSTGSATLVLGVDITPPSTITGFTATVLNRQRIGLRWTAPEDHGLAVDHYLLKVSTAALTDANFDALGVEMPAPTPAAPGTQESLELFPSRTGTTVWIGIAAVDAAGNRSPAAIAGPRTPVFAQTGAIESPTQSQSMLELGASIAHGKFDGDAFDDLAVAAPTQDLPGLPQAGVIYVYFGGPNGISSTAGLIITGTSANGHLGASMTAIRASSGTHDDLVIGAPGADGGNGRLFIFHGGSIGTGSRLASSADQQITVASTPGWFAGGALGTSMVTADIDGDDSKDIVVSAPKAGGGIGGIVTIYGGTYTGNVALSDVDPSGLGGAIVEYMPDPAALVGRSFGYHLHAVGPTQGPADTTDDLVVAYLDDMTTAGDSAYVIRGDGTRPASGIALRTFAPGRDVRIDLVTSYVLAQWGAQATSIEDQNGDGARDIAISAHRNLSGEGQVYIISGATVGVGGVAKTTDPGVALTTITGGIGMRLGSVIADHEASSHPDVDGDGKEDLIIGGAINNVARLFVWFGGTIPPGATTVASAGYMITGPTTFQFTTNRPQGDAGEARWIGDINGDGLDDVCWTSPYDSANNVDGGFEVLWDAPLP
jgi:FG-GAP repeat